MADKRLNSPSVACIDAAIAINSTPAAKASQRKVLPVLCLCGLMPAAPPQTWNQAAAAH
jgi:hypothetical protein